MREKMKCFKAMYGRCHYTIHPEKTTNNNKQSPKRTWTVNTDLEIES